MTTFSHLVSKLSAACNRGVGHAIQHHTERLLRRQRECPALDWCSAKSSSDPHDLVPRSEAKPPCCGFGSAKVAFKPRHLTCAWQ